MLIFNVIFPGVETQVTWETFLYPEAVLNPFLGQFTSVNADGSQHVPAGLRRHA